MMDCLFPIHNDTVDYVAGWEAGQTHALLSLGLPTVFRCTVRVANQEQFNTMATHYGYSVAYEEMDGYWCSATFTKTTSGGEPNE